MGENIFKDLFYKKAAYAALLALTLCAASPSAPRAAGESINSADASFSAAAGVGPAVPKQESAGVPPAVVSVLGLKGTLPPVVCEPLNGFAGRLRGFLTTMLYMIAPIPLIVFFYVFSMLFYQSLAAGSFMAFLTGWLLQKRPILRLLLVSAAIITAVFFSWDSAGIPQFGLRHIPDGEACAEVFEGWVNSGLVILIGCLGIFAGRLYAARKGQTRH